MAPAPKANSVERLVMDDLAMDLVDREIQYAALQRQYEIQHDMVTALLALVREQNTQIAILRRSIAELRGMPVD